MIAGGRVYLLVAMLLAASVACGGDAGVTASGSTGAAAELRDAVRRTLQVESLQATIAEDGQDGETHVVYQAPDRARMVNEGAPALETIFVDGAVFMNMGGETYGRVESPAPGPLLALVVYPLRLLEDADEVERRGDVFHVDLAGASADVRVEGGYVVYLRVQYQDPDLEVDQTFELTAFDEEVPSIAAPPEEQWVDMDQPADCDEFSRQLSRLLAQCLAGLDSGSPTGFGEVVELPAPAGSTDSSLQLRPVRSDEASDCEPTDTNPAASSSIELSDVHGVCFGLAPAEIEVTSVRDATARSAGEGRVDLSLTLHPADAARFDEMAERWFSHRIAMVVFGQVVAAPTINATEFGDEIVIARISPEVASRIDAALTR